MIRMLEAKIWLPRTDQFSCEVGKRDRRGEDPPGNIRILDSQCQSLLVVSLGICCLRARRWRRRFQSWLESILYLLAASTSVDQIGERGCRQTGARTNNMCTTSTRWGWREDADDQKVKTMPNCGKFHYQPKARYERRWCWWHERLDPPTRWVDEWLNGLPLFNFSPATHNYLRGRERVGGGGEGEWRDNKEDTKGIDCIVIVGAEHKENRARSEMKDRFIYWCVRNLIK